MDYIYHLFVIPRKDFTYVLLNVSKTIHAKTIKKQQLITTNNNKVTSVQTMLKTT